MLPANRSRVEIRTADGLTLQGELATPIWCEPSATLVCVHPLTSEGGSMESHVIRKISWRLPALAGLAVLRFNMRGAGLGQRASEGEFEGAKGEGLDLGAALSYCVRMSLPEVWLVGWSFGTDVTLKFGSHPPVVGAVLLSPPLSFSDQDDRRRWAESDRAVTALIPEFDDYLRPTEARREFATIPQASVIEVKGAGHLWVGERYVQRVLNEIVRAVRPIAYPLPDEFNGHMERWSDL